MGAKTKKLNDSPSKLISDYDQLVDRPIKSGETLRSISVKYRVLLPELKRVNNIMQENEFFAFTTLKIHVKPNSVLAEMLEDEKKEQKAYTGNEKKQCVASVRAALLGTRNASSCSEYENDSDMHVGYISIDHILRDTRPKK